LEVGEWSGGTSDFRVVFSTEDPKHYSNFTQKFDFTKKRSTENLKHYSNFTQKSTTIDAEIS
jgi:hypothetical protein